MVCIYCLGETQVINSRSQKRSNQVWRRRKCLNCGAIFTTEELATTEKSVVVMYMSHSEAFQREKLLISVYEALKHRKTAVQDATALTTTIIGRLYPLITDASLQREDIIQITTEVVKRFDKAAAVSYSAFHPL